MTNCPTLLIRADASVAVGTGHVMRSLALAQAWQDTGGNAVFAMAVSTPSVRQRLLAESCEVIAIPPVSGSEDGQRIIALARERESPWIVVDGYQFNAEYQRAVKVAGLKTLLLDDYGHANSYCADLVLNQNVGVDESLYRDRDRQTKLLLGPRYSLLRREFSRWRSWKRAISPLAKRVLVTMGGSDPENVTATVIEALRLSRLHGLEAVVVAGGSNPRFDVLRVLTNEVSQAGTTITVQKDVSNMPELMAWADVAISAAGTTCWELCMMGLPSLLVDVAANQSAVARELGRLGGAIYLGNGHAVSPASIAARLEEVMKSGEMRHSISNVAHKLVDGLGAERVVSLLRGADLMLLRRADEQDAKLLWEWANDPEVRAASFSPAAIPWETHAAWFAEKYPSSDCLILIAESEEGTALGQIRFEGRQDGDFEVGISITKAYRGRGIGAILIEKAVRRLLENEPSARILARVKPANEASIRAFEKAGFTRDRDDKAAGAVVLVYVSEKL